MPLNDVKQEIIDKAPQSSRNGPTGFIRQRVGRHSAICSIGAST